MRNFIFILFVGILSACVPAARSNRAAFTNEEQVFLSKMNQGRSAFSAKRYKQAEIYFSEGLLAAPTSPSAANDLGLVLQKRGSHDAAIRYFRQAHKFDPQNIIITENAMKSFLALGLYDEVIRVGNSSLSKDIKPQERVRIQALVSSAYLITGQLDEAICLAKANAANSVEGLAGLARLYMAAGNYSQSYDIFTNLTSELGLGSSHELLIDLAHTAVLTGKPKQALNISGSLLLRNDLSPGDMFQALVIIDTLGHMDEFYYSYVEKLKSDYDLCEKSYIDYPSHLPGRLRLAAEKMHSSWCAR